MRRAAALALCALAAAGCGSDEEPTRTAAPTVATTEREPPPPAAATQQPAERTDHEDTTEEARSKPPSRPYRCDGEVLRALRPTGRVRIEPNPVDAGETFEVVITDRRAQVAVVSLAGVADVPLRAEAARSGGRLSATLRMPADATCGNKLVTVEGDLAAQAYVAVRR